MTLAELRAALFPNGDSLVVDAGVIHGQGMRSNGAPLHVIGVCDRSAIGVDAAIALSRYVLACLAADDATPIVVLIDSDSQRMSKRDELLGLNEFLAHLAKTLLFADAMRHPTIGLLYGHTAAGAFIATALATRSLLALPGAEPVVMDLPSMARVTKLPLEVLQAKATSTPVFAPGLANLAQTGAVAQTLDPNRSLAEQLDAALTEMAAAQADLRDALGRTRQGRPKAAAIAARVQELARASH